MIAAGSRYGRNNRKSLPWYGSRKRKGRGQLVVAQAPVHRIHCAKCGNPRRLYRALAIATNMLAVLLRSLSKHATFRSVRSYTVGAADFFDWAELPMIAAATARDTTVNAPVLKEVTPFRSVVLIVYL
jgi:hypothetical protein